MKSRKKGIILVLSVILIFSIGLLVNNLMTNNKDTAKLKKKTVAAVKKKKETPPKPKEPFNIDFTGDIMFDWDLRPVLAEKGMDYPFNNVREELKSSDYTFVDLETAITTRTKKVPYQEFWIKSDPSSLTALKNAGVDMVNISNNHILDYYEDGLLDTTAALRANNLAYVGAGKNEDEAYQLKVADIKGNKVGFMSFCHFFPNTGWIADEDTPGVTNGYDINLVEEKIKEERAKNKDIDYMVVYFHWGVEKTNTPVDYQTQYVKKLVDDHLVDAIVASHPHWLQGFEVYKDVPIAYSLGNFLFPDYVSGHSAETGIYKLNFNQGKVTAHFDPGIISGNQINMLDGSAKTAQLNYLQSISPNATINSNGDISAK
ncbi:CapA family protein [Listeria monocytogenes]|nr:CapA family protein [Listeria monocytogenes]EAE4324259.1 CapA family protein [Listeria monocytogenes]EHH9830994.1 CapA family protein [Listeria monocytogenes]HAA7973277.1 CapA family protein [Listeria monocytogenes]HAA9406391.1 CapA family protein [Listeria monocytogenes]